VSAGGAVDEGVPAGDAVRDEGDVAVAVELAETAPTPGSPAANDAQGERQRFVLAREARAPLRRNVHSQRLRHVGETIGFHRAAAFRRHRSMCSRPKSSSAS
jgi:hypothetical protein